MKFDLQELLEQKALLEKHLAWLDAKIRQLRGEGTADVESEAGQAAKTEKANAGTSVPPVLEMKYAAIAPREKAESAPVEMLENQLQPSPEPITKKAKFGCVLFCIAIMALVIYVLFVMPYHCQRYSDADQEPAETQSP